VLKLENVHASYGHSEALRGVSLEVNESEIVTIIGPNGSGKTTTLRVIFGLLPATEGVVTIELTARGNDTDLDLRHERFASDDERDKHAQGWNDCLDRLPGWLAVSL